MAQERRAGGWFFQKADRTQLQGSWRHKPRVCAWGAGTRCDGTRWGVAEPAEEGIEAGRVLKKTQKVMVSGLK